MILHRHHYSSFIEEYVMQQDNAIAYQKFFSARFLVRKPKASWLHLRRCCYRLSSNQGSDPYRHHWCRRRWQRWLRLGTSQ
jgi:hypothetical protein